MLDYRAVGALAFDLDGTLIHTLPDLAAAGNRMLRELGRPAVTEHTVRGYIGDGVAVLVRRLLSGDAQAPAPPDMLERALPVFMRVYAEELVVRSRPFAGVEQGLAVLGARFPLACVTNKAMAYTEPLLRALGLHEHFAVVLGGDSLPRKKPDALPFTHCAAALGVEPARLLVVGDAANDCAAARAAGCPVVCVPYGYAGRAGAQGLDCDAIVTDLCELAEQLQQAHA